MKGLTWDELEPETRNDIGSRPFVTTKHGTQWDCGCDTSRHGRLYLCGFHDGYDVAVEVLRREGRLS